MPTTLLRPPPAAVLDSTFNTYDEPMVLASLDAINTHLRTGVDFLTIGNFLVSRVDPAGGARA